MIRNKPSFLKHWRPLIPTPIEIGLDDTAFTGPDLEKLAAFYDEMGFVQFKNALGGELCHKILMCLCRA